MTPATPKATPPAGGRTAEAARLEAAAGEARAAGRAGRHRTPSHDVEQALLAAAARLLEAEGRDALSVRRIAGEASCAPMGVYSRFGGIGGVIEALFRSGFDQLRDVLLDVPTGDPIEELAVGCERYRQFALERPQVYAVMFDRVLGDAPPASCRVHAAGAFNVVVGVIRRGQAAGTITEGDPVELAQRVWSCCHGAVSLELRGLGFVDDRDDHYRALVATVLRGLAPA